METEDFQISKIYANDNILRRLVYWGLSSSNQGKQCQYSFLPAAAVARAK